MSSQCVTAISTCALSQSPTQSLSDGFHLVSSIPMSEIFPVTKMSGVYMSDPTMNMEKKKHVHVRGIQYHVWVNKTSRIFQQRTGLQDTMKKSTERPTVNVRLVLSRPKNLQLSTGGRSNRKQKQSPAIDSSHKHTKIKPNEGPTNNNHQCRQPRTKQAGTRTTTAIGRRQRQ